ARGRRRRSRGSPGTWSVLRAGAGASTAQAALTRQGTCRDGSPTRAFPLGRSTYGVRVDRQLAIHDEAPRRAPRTCIASLPASGDAARQRNTNRRFAGPVYLGRGHRRASVAACFRPSIAVDVG